MSQNLRALVGDIRKKYGKGAMAQASRGRTFDPTRYSTGILQVDLAIGGGLPWGKVIMVHGPESGGKTFLWLKTLASAQNYCRYCRARFLPDAATGEVSCSCPAVCGGCEKPFAKLPYDGPPPAGEDPFDWEEIHDLWSCECMVQGKTKKKSDKIPLITQRAGQIRCAWLDAEHSYDVNWTRRLGVNNKTVYVILPEYAEQGIDIATAMIRSNEIDILVVDSIADLVPSTEIEASTEDWQVGLQARLVNKACRKWRAAINHLGADNPQLPSVLLINQLRSKVSRYGGEVLPGGRQQLFTVSINIRMNTPKYETSDETGESIFQDINGFTKKNKTYPPKHEFSFRAYLRPNKGRVVGDTDEVATVVSHALDWAVIERPKPSIYTYKDRKWTSQKAVAESLLEELLLFYEIRQEVIDVVGAEVRGE